MSIVIATLEENICVNIFADRLLVSEFEDGTIFETKEISKIYELTETISCGMTGDAEWGVSLASELIKYQDIPASGLIKIIENFDRSFNNHSTFILGGKYDDGKLFIYGYKTENSKGKILFENSFFIATSPNKYLEDCVDFYSKLKNKGYGNIQSATDTINFASEQNPKYISKKYNHIQINF